MSKWGIYDFDFSKINIFVKSEAAGITGSRLYDILLKEYHLQMEMVSKDYVLAMTSICDTGEGMERLAKALEEIDRRIRDEKNQYKRSFVGLYIFVLHKSSVTAFQYFIRKNFIHRTDS